MLYTAKSLKGFRLQATDGELGSVQEFYFDDTHWAVRYLIADTGTWLSGRQVLISPYALGAVDVRARSIAVQLTKKKIEGSPSLGSDLPVSQQFEGDYNAYFGWPIYWGGPFMWGANPYLSRGLQASLQGGPTHKPWNPHLRSSRHLTGHVISAKDGEIGHVADFIVDDGTWAVRYLVIDTHAWWPGKKVLIAPRWIESINWDHGGTMNIDLKRDAIRMSPEYTEDGLLGRNHEAALHKHYGRKEYWAEETPTPGGR